jgi:outer membrane lipoprotein SlyB
MVVRLDFGFSAFGFDHNRILHWRATDAIRNAAFDQMRSLERIGEGGMTRLRLRWVRVAGLVASLVWLAACAPQQPFLSGVTSSTEGSTLVQRGRVAEVRDVKVSGGAQPVAGGVVGGLVGGILGSTLGGGNGHILGAAGGTIAGSVAGNAAGKAASTQTLTRLVVEFPNGERSSVDVDPADHFAVGEMVTVTTTNSAVRVSR